LHWLGCDCWRNIGIGPRAVNLGGAGADPRKTQRRLQNPGRVTELNPDAAIGLQHFTQIIIAVHHGVTCLSHILRQAVEPR
jgi:hypothetical protein